MKQIKFYNPIAQHLFEENRLDQLLIVQSYGLPVLAMIDQDEPKGYLELQNEHETVMELIFKNYRDIQVFESLKSAKNYSIDLNNSK